MNRPEHHKLIIIGCGASGMMAAISAAVYCHDILLIDRNQVPGKKITATGNGKCNFTNSEYDGDCYRSTDTEAVSRITDRFTYKDTIAFFKTIGIIAHERNGYYYPNSGQASSVRDALVNRLRELGCRIVTDHRVTSITHRGDIYDIDGTYTAERLILATGGSAQPVFGTDGNMLDIVKGMGHHIIEPHPALTGLTSDMKHLKTIAGVRCEAEVALYIDKQLHSTEYGEIIFNKNGISGIPVMDRSTYAIAARAQGSEVTLSLDLIPSMTADKLKEYLIHRIEKSNSLNIEELCNGLLNNKLMYVILLLSHTDPAETDRAQMKRATGEIVRYIKSFRLNITGDNGYENAQVSAGGIRLTEIDSTTLESRHNRGLYFAGEILDVDGRCGGYNLQWAWTTGAIAGAYAGGGSFDKDKLIKG